MKFIVLIIMAFIALFTIQSVMAGSKNAKENRRLGEEFLAANKKAEGVRTTASGLQYKVLQKGTGAFNPRRTDTVEVHYHGTLIDGTVFDSSVDRDESISFPLHRVIKGWKEGIRFMVIGEKARLFIPSNLAYGNRKSGVIPAGSTLIFDVELLDIYQ